MHEFSFNKVYVIESLNSTQEKLTGKELYDDLLRWKEYQIKDFKAELIQIENKADFKREFDLIKVDCANIGYYPILHFEIHGSRDKTGLVLRSNELVTWEELYDGLVELNSMVGNNLFITMAVCYGAYIMELIRINKPSPFWGIIGSFETIYESDILLRYNEFYNEFLSDFNLSKAIQRLHTANPAMPSTYHFINSEQVFKNINKKYFTEKFSEEQITLRFNDGLSQHQENISDMKLWFQLREKFKELLLGTKREVFETHKRTFFMIDNFPLNANRFPVNYEEVCNQ